MSAVCDDCGALMNVYDAFCTKCGWSVASKPARAAVKRAALIPGGWEIPPEIGHPTRPFYARGVRDTEIVYDTAEPATPMSATRQFLRPMPVASKFGAPAPTAWRANPPVPDDGARRTRRLAAGNQSGSRRRGGRSARDAHVTVHSVVKSQIAVGDGNVQVQVTVDGASQFGQLEGGVALRVREIPALATAHRPDPVGRGRLIEQVSRDVLRGTTVQLFGIPGVGRAAVVEAVLGRLAAAGVRGVQLLPGNQPHTLESLYRRLVEVFFGAKWYQPEEAVLRVEVVRADLHALILITDCDLDRTDLARLLGSFPGCTFLLTSCRQTLPDDAGAAYEVDPLTPGQARELIRRALGGDPAGLQNLQWEEAYRLAGGQVQRLIEHVAFVKRVARRPGQTDLLLVPLKEQVAVLVAGLGEPARRVLLALSTFGLALTPAVFAAVTGLPAAAHTTGELLAAGLISPEGHAYRIAPDAAAVLAARGERTDPKVAADGLMPLLDAPDPPDPHLLLVVARALHRAGHDAYASRLTRAAAPLALAAGEVEVWIHLVALGVQAATTARRKPDLEYFLNEQHTSSLLRGDTVAAAAALAALATLLSDQHVPAHTSMDTSKRGRRLIRHGRRALSAGHGAGAGAVAAVLVTAIVVAIPSHAQPTRQLTGGWTDPAGTSYDFVATTSSIYTASQNVGEAPRCHRPDDVKVTGKDGRYRGSIKLYSANTSETGCEPAIGVGTITINVAANDDTAQVTTSGENCVNCSTETWTRGSASSSPS
jgi:hypothetical protein